MTPPQMDSSKHPNGSAAESGREEWYVLGSEGLPRGPYSQFALLEAISKAQIDRGTLLARRGDHLWRPAHEVLKLSRLEPTGSSTASRAQNLHLTSLGGMAILVCVGTSCLIAGALAGYLSADRLANNRRASAASRAEQQLRQPEINEPPTAKSAALPPIPIGDHSRLSSSSNGTGASAAQVASANSPKSTFADIQGEGEEFTPAPVSPHMPDPNRPVLPSAPAAPSSTKTAPTAASTALQDQVFLARNGSNLLIWAKLGDYDWRDFGMRNYAGHERGGLDWVYPAGPDAIALVERYIDALGTVHRPKTYAEMNQGFINDLELMGAHSKSPPTTAPGGTSSPSASPAVKKKASGPPKSKPSSSP